MQDCPKVSTQPQLPKSHQHHLAQCLREIQHCNNLLADSKEPWENHILLSEYYTCISPEPTKCELLGETQSPDIYKRKHSCFSPSVIPAISATVQRVTEFICKQH